MMITDKKKYKLVAASLLLLVVSPLLEAQTYRSYIRTVEESLGNRSFQDAINQAAKAIEMRPDDHRGYVLRATASDSLNRHLRAAEDYDRAAGLQPGQWEHYCNAAKNYYLSGRTDLAAGRLDKAIDIGKKNWDAYELKVVLLMEEQEYQRAHDLCGQVLLQKEIPELRYLSGIINMHLDKYSEAERDFSLAGIETDNGKPVDAPEHINLVMEEEDPDHIKGLLHGGLVKARKAESGEMARETGNEVPDVSAEDHPPEIQLKEPLVDSRGTIILPEGTDSVYLSGIITDDSELAELLLNGQAAALDRVNDQVVFAGWLDINGSDSLLIVASDIYDNTVRTGIPFSFTESAPPEITVIAPYASENNIIYLDSYHNEINLDGYVEDHNLISSILVNGVSANYLPDEMNPVFTARLDIADQDEIIITATDVYGNRKSEVFRLNREAAILSQENPMGKTWVVFIENTDYENLLSLQYPGKDVSLMKTALAKYRIHGFVHKQNLTKSEMERFFSIELRDLIKSNQVNSLLIWYSGHGAYIDETGYWLPADASPGEQFTYYNINALKASMYSYVNSTSHILIISDACHPGPGFYDTVPAAMEVKSCDDPGVSGLNSTQIFTSSGNGPAYNNSMFSRFFASTLNDNTDYCIPVESVVMKVTEKVLQGHRQETIFGTISGLSDEGGTFFFVRKD